jgi:hypothetical protein
MPALSIAIEQKRWAAVAYCLLLGIVEAANKLPPDAVSTLLAVLEEAPEHGLNRH